MIRARRFPIGAITIERPRGTRHGLTSSLRSSEPNTPMKSLSSCLLGMLCLAATPLLPAQTYQAKQTLAAIAVDGALNESVWNEAGNASVAKLVLGASANNTVTFSALWNSTHLYVAIRVTDSALHNDSTSVWLDDAIEVYIDANHNHGTTYDSFDRQFTKGYNDSAVGEKNNLTTGVLQGWSAVAGGYTIELAIPWSNLGITPSTNLTIGFDVGNNDDDNGGDTRESQVVWNGTVNNYQNTSAFGDLVLSATTVGDNVPPTVAISAPAANAPLGGSVSVTATASDNVGVVGVQFKLDGANLDAEDTVAPFAVTWDTTTATQGAHTLTAVARDAAGNTTTSAAVPVHVRSYRAPRTLSPIAIDGNLNESVWSLNGTASKLVHGSGANNTTTFAALWDHEYLYVAARVLDGSLYNDSTDVWLDDSVEVYLDANHNHGTTYDASDRQFTKGYNDSVLGGIGSQTGVLHATAAITGGYTIELAIPWSNLGITPVADSTTLGFDVGNNDDDNGGTTRENQLMWAGTSTNSTNTSAFGDLLLLAQTVGIDTSAPTVAVTAPANGATVSGVVNVAATATDNVGVVGVQFRLDGVDLGAEDTVAPYQVSWDTATASAGAHVLTAVARDAAGNTTTSAGINVTVQAAGGGTSTQLEAEAFAATSGATISGGHVTSLNNGDWIRFNGVDLGAGRLTFQARVASSASAANYGQLQVRLGSATGTQIAALRVLNTGGDTTWEVQTAAISGGTGVQDVYIVVAGGNGTSICNLDWIKLRSDMLPRGATMPFVTYEAEDGTFTGSLNGSTDSFHRYGASGREYIWLDATNEYVQWTASLAANRLTLRYGVPQNTSGTIGVFVNSTLHVVNVAGTYCYDSSAVTTKPRRYDEVTIPVTVAPGDIVKVQKRSADTLAWYAIDLVDLEFAPAAASAPAGFLSVTAYGANGGDQVADNQAIKDCIAAAAAGNKKVFFPSGTFIVENERIAIPADFEVRGAGLWYTTIHNPSPAAFSGTNANTGGFKLGANSRLSHLKITGVATSRATGMRAVDPDPSGASGLVFEDLMVQNIGVLIGWRPYHSATFRNLRFIGNYYDGIHLGDGPVTNCLVENCFFRGLGDDSIAQVNRTDYGLCTGNVAQFNTIVATYHGRNIVNIGGDDFTVRDNYIDGGFLAGIMIATETLSPSYSRPIQQFKVQRNTIRMSGHTGHNHAGIHFWLSQNFMSNVKIEDNRIELGETRGIRIDNTSHGDANGRTQFNYNVSANNAQANYDDASTAIVPVLTGNAF